MSEIFLSYAHEDKAEAKHFADALLAAGFSVWWDAAIQTGDSFDMRIEAAIREAKVVIVLWSEKSVVSRWVRAEAMLAERLKILAPVRIGVCELPIMFELTQTADLSDWDGSLDDNNWTAFLDEVRQFTARSSEPQGTESPKKLPAISPSTKPEILILPFVNMSGEPDQEYFSDGVSEDIITDLGKVSALSVVSRRKAFSYKGKTLSTHAARDLNISYILEGSVRKSGNRVRITAQLLDASSDAQLWSERFDRTLDDIFAIQDEISEAIVTALKVKLAPLEKRAIERRATTNAEAYELFVMARQFSRGGSERMQPIIERICKKVVELDPEFANAWALLAFAQAEMLQRGVQGQDSDGGLFAAERAVSLDPDLAEGHAALAEVHGRSNTVNIAVGEPYVRRALELDPNCYEANLYAGYVYLGQRKFVEAIHYYEKALTLDDVAYRPAGMVLQAYLGLGDTDNLHAAARRCLERCEKLLTVEPDHAGALGFYVSALVFLGKMDQANNWARRAVIFHPDNLRLLYNLACAFAEAADATRAIELLAGALRGASESWLRWVESDNSFDLIRDDLQFKTLLIEARKRFSN